MKKTKGLLILLLGLIIISCSSEDNNENNSNESRIDVTINGTEYTFNTFTFEKHFEDPNDSYYYVTARIDNESDLVFDFGVELGYTGDWENGEIVDEFNLYTNFIESGNYDCAYFGVDIPYPQINVSVNNEQEFKATFSFENNFDVSCNSGNENAPFGNRVTYTNGTINLKL
ncbi:hypothetical protein [uncultured Algibacter sp.]|uniref:hypothetical protein n=1 Tax=uncultured Algibacter sp. TaxID=298659 RepID=UPI00262ABD80|nr:hypothetical protein [uncultured Algibacter sp.]